MTAVKKIILSACVLPIFYVFNPRLRDEFLNVSRRDEVAGSFLPRPSEKGCGQHRGQHRSRGAGASPPLMLDSCLAGMGGAAIAPPTSLVEKDKECTYLFLVGCYSDPHLGPSQGKS